VGQSQTMIYKTLHKTQFRGGQSYEYLCQVKFQLVQGDTEM